MLWFQIPSEVNKLFQDNRCKDIYSDVRYIAPLVINLHYVVFVVFHLYVSRTFALITI